MRICFDLDGTICENKKPGQTYIDVEPMPGAIECLKELKAKGHYIIIQTARHMVTYQSNEGKIIANLGYLYEWLKKWDVPYDELYIGKPHADIFVDDKAYKHLTWNLTHMDIIEKNKKYNTTLDFSNKDIEKLEHIYSYGIKTRPIESNGPEYVECLKFLSDKNLHGFIEIGSAAGGSFHLFSSLLKDGLKISIDLPIIFNNQITNEIFEKRLSIWREYFTDVYSIVGDSHNLETINILKSILNGKKVDWLYIDADHTYSAVKSDFELYKDFVNDGGYIGFHDINAKHFNTNDYLGVHEFWNELKLSYPNKFIEINDDVGIGILQI